MLIFSRLAPVIGCLFLLAFAPAPAQENAIHAVIGGLRNDHGRVVCALFQSADGFPKASGKAVAHVSAAISNRQAVCEFQGVAAGVYAISAFHDANANGTLDTGLLGIPREGVGASNDAKGRFGPPKFDAAKFRFAGGRMEMKITIQYL